MGATPPFLNDSPAAESSMDKALPFLPVTPLAALATPRFTRSRNLTPKVTPKWEFSPGKKRSERERKEQEEEEKGNENDCMDANFRDTSYLSSGRKVKR